MNDCPLAVSKIFTLSHSTISHDFTETSTNILTRKVKVLSRNFTYSNLSIAFDFKKTSRKETLKEGEEVDLLVYQKTDIGFSVIVNNTHKGLIFENEIFKEISGIDVYSELNIKEK